MTSLRRLLAGDLLRRSFGCHAASPPSSAPIRQSGCRRQSKKSPMELISEVPPIKVDHRIVACEGDSNPALGHPFEFICLHKEQPAICKYSGLRYVPDHRH